MSPFDQEEHWYQWGDGGPTTQLRDPMITKIVLEQVIVSWNKQCKPKQVVVCILYVISALLSKMARFMGLDGLKSKNVIKQTPPKIQFYILGEGFQAVSGTYSISNDVILAPTRPF